MTIAQWSTTPGNNATGVTNVNWAEGQAPSTVNNSARQEMADVATWYRNSAEWIDRNDTVAYSSGTIVTFTSQDVTSIYNVGRRIKVTASTPGTLYGRITSSSTSGSDTLVGITWDTTAVLSNEAISDVAVGIIGNSTGTQSLDAENIPRIAQFGMPTGVILPYGSTASEPTGFLFCNGQAVSRTTYADLFAVVSTTYGSTDANTFRTPDLRGRAVVCLDNLGGTSANVLTSTAADTLGGTLGVQSTSQSVSLTGGVSSHTLSASEIPSLTYSIGVDGGAGGGGSNTYIGNSSVIGVATATATGAVTTNAGGGGHTHSDTFAVSSTDTVSVVQPSFALPYIIKI